MKNGSKQEMMQTDEWPHTDCEDEQECRKMVQEMLDTEDRGFTSRQIDILDSLYEWEKPYSEKQKQLIISMYSEKM